MFTSFRASIVTQNAASSCYPSQNFQDRIFVSLLPCGYSSQGKRTCSIRCVQYHRGNVGKVPRSTRGEWEALGCCGGHCSLVLCMRRRRQTPCPTKRSAAERLLGPPHPEPPDAAGLQRGRRRRPTPSRGQRAAPDPHRAAASSYLPSAKRFKLTIRLRFSYLHIN